MQIYMRVCPICAKENIREAWHSKIYVPGWVNWYNIEPSDEETCLKHKNQKLIKMAMTCEEFQILYYISNEPSFMQAMNDLKEKDIIEYNLKMGQFKTQAQQIQQLDEQQENNLPKCPTCGSTNLKRISGLSKAGSVAMWGFLSQKVKKTYHCNKCGYEW
ncbi:hypothetical protein AALB16_16535 [Lachnospiraceae bacterium 62-35]